MRMEKVTQQDSAPNGGEFYGDFLQSHGTPQSNPQQKSPTKEIQVNDSSRLQVWVSIKPPNPGFTNIQISQKNGLFGGFVLPRCFSGTDLQILFFVRDKSLDTVDGSEIPNNHQGCITSCK